MNFDADKISVLGFQGEQQRVFLEAQRKASITSMRKKKQYFLDTESEFPVYTAC